MSFTIDELARTTGLRALGDGTLRVDFPAEPAKAGPHDLALAMDPAYADALNTSEARAAVIWEGADWEVLGLQAALVAARPRVAMAGITDAFQHAPDLSSGIHATAAVDASAELGKDVWIGPFAAIGPRAVIGDGTRIGAHVAIGADAEIGAHALLHDGVRFGARCRAGVRLIAQPNAVIGADGFSFEPPQRGAVESARETGHITGTGTTTFLRIHSLAAVEIGDDVEIGACSTIDRGTISPTRIGSGTKIDNQVQIGHNVQVGSTCLLCAQVGIAGSTKIGDRVILGGKAGVGDHVTIGSDCVFAAGSLVAGDVPDRSVMLGIPAAPRNEAARQIVAVRRLPKLVEDVRAIKRKLGL